jgi:CxxC motif-containing protein (DUF1111 family)
VPQSLVDFEEFYLLHYFKPATHRAPDRGTEIDQGRALFVNAGCATCHVPDLTINRDRRVADVETNFADFNPADGTFNATTQLGDGNPLNRLFARATGFPVVWDDPVAEPTIKSFASNTLYGTTNPIATAAPRTFVVRNFFADLKRHDLGPNFAERFFDGSLLRQIMTEPLWGVGTTAPYGHDGRTHSLEEVILRHGGEALASRNAFNALSRASKNQVLSFLNHLVLFAPDDTASNLQPITHTAANFPQSGHGSIALTVLFNNPADIE